MNEEQSSQETIQTETDASKTSFFDPFTAAAQTNSIHAKQQIFQTYMIVCLYTNMDERNDHASHIQPELEEVVKDVHTFRDTEQCIAFLTDLEDVETYLIIVGDHGEQIIPRIHDIGHLNYIYILCNDSSQYESCSRSWFKIKDVCTHVTPICSALKQIIKQFDQNFISMSFISNDNNPSNQNLEKLDPPYMYTQLFKEILLDIDYDQKAIEEFAAFLRRESGANCSNINRFEREYRPESAIEWYQREPSFFVKVNQALRTLDANLMIKMGFFICDLHRQIQDLHSQQISRSEKKEYVRYRGQALSEPDFEKLKKKKGGLLSFNNFLSTSKDYNVARAFAESNSQSSQKIGILFKLKIDSSTSSASFADLGSFGIFTDEQEILFSMHTVFRIEKILKIDSTDRLYKVTLKLTNNDDEDLRDLADRLRMETPGPTAWERLGRLLNKIGRFDKAEELYTALLDKTHDDSRKALYYNQLGLVKYHQHCYQDSTDFYEKFREILQNRFAADYPLFATYFNNIGMTYDAIGEYSKALSFHKKSLRVRKATLPSDHLDLATSYNNMGLAYDKLKKYSEALSCFQSSLDIKRETLPENHPDFAQTYNNMGLVHMNMKDYEKASSCFQEALRIKEASLPENHPSLAYAYNNIGLAYYNAGDYTQALLFYEKDLKISEENPRSNDHDLAYSYNNIAGVYYKNEEYLKAQSYFERAYTIFRSLLPPTHPDLQVVQRSIKLVNEKSQTNYNA
jgi:tetratricopeptide (TPR) repeat protein